MDNNHVKVILSVMAENWKDTSGLTALLNYVASMENHLNKAYDEVQTMRRELNGLREERDHPVRTLLQSLENNINEASKSLNQLKEKIIDGCKDAVDMFKQKGISALNNIAHFFKVKPTLETMRQNMRNLIKDDLSSIAKIEAISAEYHAAGRHLQNIVRALRGKEPIQNVKTNGKITHLLTEPYRTEIHSASVALKNIEKAIARLDHLDKAATFNKPIGEGLKSTTSTDKTLTQTESAGSKAGPKEFVSKSVVLRETPDAAVSTVKPASKNEAINGATKKATPTKTSINKSASEMKTTVKPSVAADLAKYADQVKIDKVAQTVKSINKLHNNPEL